MCVGVCVYAGGGRVSLVFSSTYFVCYLRHFLQAILNSSGNIIRPTSCEHSLCV